MIRKSRRSSTNPFSHLQMLWELSAKYFWKTCTGKESKLCTSKEICFEITNNDLGGTIIYLNLHPSKGCNKPTWHCKFENPTSWVGGKWDLSKLHTRKMVWCKKTMSLELYWNYLETKPSTMYFVERIFRFPQGFGMNKIQELVKT